MRSIVAWKRRAVGEVMVIGGVDLYVMALALCERTGSAWAGPPHSAAREAPRAAPHHYRDPRPAMAQSLHRSLSEADLLVT